MWMWKSVMGKMLIISLYGQNILPHHIEASQIDFISIHASAQKCGNLILTANTKTPGKINTTEEVLSTEKSLKKRS